MFCDGCGSEIPVSAPPDAPVKFWHMVCSPKILVDMMSVRDEVGGDDLPSSVTQSAGAILTRQFCNTCAMTRPIGVLLQAKATQAP